MNKYLMIVALFVGFSFSAQKTEADDNSANILKKIGNPQNNPWDPRGRELPENNDSSGKEALPDPEQTESETEE